MIFLTLDEWGNRIISGRYEVLGIRYSKGFTIIKDIDNNKIYKATWKLNPITRNGRIMLEESTFDGIKFKY